MNSLAIQGMIYSALAASTDLDAALARQRTISGTTLTSPAIYDNVPQGVYGDDSAFPYIVIGDDTDNAFNTDGSQGSDATVDVHIWSRQMGRAETKGIQGLVFDALSRQDLNIADKNVVNIEQITALTYLDPDGKTRHGVQSFRVIVE